MGEYTIKPCTMGHVQRYGEIYAAAFSGEPWNDAWKAADAEVHVREILEMEQAFGLEYVEDGVVAGFILGSSMVFHYGRTFEINDLAVDPAYQGRGIARTLLEACLSALREQGICGVHMITQGDGFLPEFYKGYGFKEENEVILMGLDMDEEDDGSEAVDDADAADAKDPAPAVKSRIDLGRSFITKFADDGSIPETYMTDQELKKPQPPLAKAPMTGNIIGLPNDFDKLEVRSDFLGIVNDRKSHRVYTDQPLTLRELSYLLWCTQGVKDVRGRSYATIRTVPCGGARHEFECYMAIRRVEGLEPGLYHYLPMTHQIEFLGESADMGGFISKSLQEQNWALKSSVVFYYSCVFYRAEWRYGPWAHPVILMDSGHITENLYLAATSIGLGGCAIAAVDPEACNREFGLDGVEETIFYAMPVGTVDPTDRESEDAFYAFVREEGL